MQYRVYILGQVLEMDTMEVKYASFECLSASCSNEAMMLANTRRRLL